jgi:hypothetical protein
MNRHLYKLGGWGTECGAEGPSYATFSSVALADCPQCLDNRIRFLEEQIELVHRRKASLEVKK